MFAQAHWTVAERKMHRYLNLVVHVDCVVFFASHSCCGMVSEKCIASPVNIEVPSGTHLISNKCAFW